MSDDVVFVGCSITDAAEPVSPSGGAAPLRQVILDGRRVKTVDVHAHCAVPKAMALMGMEVSPEAPSYASSGIRRGVSRIFL